jgi:hypothetical protein
MVAANFFETLGLQPALGRLFAAEEYVKNGRPAVLLSYFFWNGSLPEIPPSWGKRSR